MTPAERLIFALDVPDFDSAVALVGELAPHVGGFKVGLELLVASGMPIVRLISLSSFGNFVMLDLKMHDIPETVERAVFRAGDLGVRFLTLHVQQRETLRRAAKAAEKGGVQLLGVTVLTSMTDNDCHDLGYDQTPAVRALYLAKLAWEEGITGFVCSPQEVATIRAALPKSTLVVPGVRPAGASAGDQKRTGTPLDAVRSGADHIVVGRPIRDAENRKGAADAIVREISGT